MHMRARNIATRRSLEAGSKMQTETDLVRATSHETNRAQLLCRPLNTSNHQRRPASSTIEQCKSAAPRGAQGAVLELPMSARQEDVFRSARVLRPPRLLQSWHEPAAAAPPRFARRAAAASAFYTEPQRATPPLALRLAGARWARLYPAVRLRGHGRGPRPRRRSRSNPKRTPCHRRQQVAGRRAWGLAPHRGTRTRRDRPPIPGRETRIRSRRRQRRGQSPASAMRRTHAPGAGRCCLACPGSRGLPVACPPFSSRQGQLSSVGETLTAQVPLATGAVAGGVWKCLTAAVLRPAGSLSLPPSLSSSLSLPLPLASRLPRSLPLPLPIS